ncbi:L-erythro-3,5-diaminohexanoate dehydrogenase [Trebonia sp.]|uniref:L-erythro-3,5-diaminohexanoate dehydrogenase n=1 Tax=Trebonia sp. TaxID=2767075 RepID=UPI00261653EC|nr:L-erythro-3,5-diaminohexanoate dehydrogenase [Trebonia sp.]
MARSADGSPLAASLGLTRVADPGERLAGVLPQAAWRLDASPRIGPDEVRIRVDRLNLDAASYRQLSDSADGDGDAIREAVREIIASRGKMHNPVTGSGGMLTGVVAEVGQDSPLGLAPGDRVATLVSLTLTPLEVYDGLERWDGLSEQVPCDGHAILFGRSVAAVLPGDLPVPLALSVLDVCGAPALTRRVLKSLTESAPRGPVVAILGAAGKSGSLSAAAARQAGASWIIGVVPGEAEASLLRQANDLATTLPPPRAGANPPAPPLVDEVVIADAREPVLLAQAITARGGPADVTVVCVDVPGCEGGAILSTAQGGTVVFFSMATSFSAAALGAEGAAADVTMLIGNGYVPGHAAYALDLIRANPAVRALFDHRAQPHPAARHDECDRQPVIGGSMSHSSGGDGHEGGAR